MSKSINIVPIKMNKINRVKATIRPQNVIKEKIEKEEIDYSKVLNSKQTLTKYQNIMENAKSKVSKKVETKTSKVEGIQNLFGGIKEKAHEMYKSTDSKVTGIKDAVASGAKKVIKTRVKVEATSVNGGISATKGILNLGESLVDGAQIVSKMSEMPFLVMADAANYVGCKVTNQEYKSILKNSWEQTRERVAYKAVDTLYDKMYDTKIGKAIDNAAYLKREGTACKIVEDVSSVIGVIVASTVTGGTAAGGAVSTMANNAGIMAGFAGVKGIGEGSEEAFQNKEVSTARGVLYGAANGAYEGLQYYLGAKIGNAMPVKEGAKISSGLAKGLNSLFHIGFDAVDGGTEGGIRPLLKKIYEDKSYDELFQENGGWSAVLTNAAIEGSVSAIGEGIDAIGIGKKIFASSAATDGDVKLNSIDDVLNEYQTLMNDPTLKNYIDLKNKGVNFDVPPEYLDQYSRLVYLENLLSTTKTSSLTYSTDGLTTKLQQDVEQFDFQQFFREDKDGAVLIITPEGKMYGALCNDNGHGQHGEKLDEFYRSIYGKESSPSNENYLKIDNACLETGNVILQLVSEDDLGSIIHYPHQISQKQYNALQNISKDIQNLASDDISPKLKFYRDAIDVDRNGGAEVIDQGSLDANLSFAQSIVSDSQK